MDRPTKITFGEMGEMGVRGIQPRRAYRAPIGVTSARNREGPGARTGARVIALKSDVSSVIVSGCAPVEQVVEPNFHHLDIAVVGGERVAAKDWGRGRYDEGPVF